MIPAKFEYVAPTTLDDAIAHLRAHDGEAKVLSGGQSLLPMLKLRLATPTHIVDINRIAGLSYITEANGVLRIGALTREGDLERSALVRAKFPILADATAVIADPLVRSSATVCGNIAHGDPGNDHPACMLALGASAVAQGPKGERVIPMTSFFQGLFTTALASDEILTELRIPIPGPKSGGAYFKLERKVGDYATAAVAVQLSLAADGTVSGAGVGLTNVGPVPIKSTKTEAFLKGKKPNDATILEAAKLVAGDAQPIADRRGSTDYKRDMVRVLAMRALRRAAERAAKA